jgi:hypothetical protein
MSWGRRSCGSCEPHESQTPEVSSRSYLWEDIYRISGITMTRVFHGPESFKWTRGSTWTMHRPIIETSTDWPIMVRG